MSTLTHQEKAKKALATLECYLPIYFGKDGEAVSEAKKTLREYMQSEGSEWVNIYDSVRIPTKIQFEDKHGNRFRGNYSRSDQNFYAYGFDERITDVVRWRPAPPVKSVDNS